jgi:hypothetical protein
MVVDSIAQAIGGLLEILHGLVDLFFRSAAIDRVAINRSIETGAERIRAFVDATQQIFHLLIARTGWLLRRQGRIAARERERGGQGDNWS